MGRRTSTVSITLPIHVRVDGDQLRFTRIEQAQAFIATLQQKVDATIEGTGFVPVPLDELQSPGIDADGWIDRKALYAFYAQRLNGQTLHNRVTNLDRAMYHSACPFWEWDTSLFEMRCSECQGALMEQDENGSRSRHDIRRRHFEIKASSIIKDAEAFHERQVSEGRRPKRMLEDFDLLVAALKQVQ